MQISGLTKAQNNELEKFVLLTDELCMIIPFATDLLILMQELKLKCPFTYNNSKRDYIIKDLDIAIRNNYIIVNFLTKLKEMKGQKSMQYLVNKTNGVLALNFGSKVGAITLTPYEARPVNVERDWDAYAFNTLRMMPTKIGLFENVPKELVTKRNMYLEITDAQEKVRKGEQVDEMEKVIASATKELKVEEGNIEKAEKDLKEIKVSLDDAKKLLTSFAKDSERAKEQVRNIKNIEKEYVTAKQALDAQKLDYKHAVEALEDLKTKKQKLEND